jgi:predicted  nucleic acid-binding Zn-ribbon protein
MAADVDALRARASDLEDRILAVLDEREPLDGVVAGLEGELVALDRRRGESQAELAAAEQELDGEIAALAGPHQAAASAVDGDLRAAYERIRGRLGGVGAARLVGSRCDGCHLTLPATELDRIRHGSGDEVVTCEQCGRILVG